ncbi:hypothetical protein SAMN04488503_0389 [Humidesulfovibrio mexicanus]|uniref:Uncharacterized protein n=1 Tax=Humidesulfovibrio mexicanus TaxID=147047 RepID=A0A238XS42_9BACT|nr:hypothetical protein [Humidesulfovibrio mexicanus]SNR61757.1 hypothetical protein SAMN04488503_0389 [Humidesulfovibrio mexicanus]
MSGWIFAFVVLLFGFALAYLLDRMKSRRGSRVGEPRLRSERAKWLYLWFFGRFPTENEEREDEEEAEREAERLEAERRKKKPGR